MEFPLTTTTEKEILLEILKWKFFLSIFFSPLYVALFTFRMSPFVIQLIYFSFPIKCLHRRVVAIFACYLILR